MMMMMMNHQAADSGNPGVQFLAAPSALLVAAATV